MSRYTHRDGELETEAGWQSEGYLHCRPGGPPGVRQEGEVQGAASGRGEEGWWQGCPQMRGKVLMSLCGTASF